MRKFLAVAGLTLLAALAVWWGGFRAPQPSAPVPAASVIPPAAGTPSPTAVATNAAFPANTPRGIRMPRVYSFGTFGPATLADVPGGRFREQLAALPPGAQTRALATLSQLHVPVNDIGSLHADPTGQLFYACTLVPKGSHAAPTQPAGTEAEAPAAVTPGVQADTLPIFSVPVPSSLPPLRHSRPGATKVIYLDFSGYTVSGTAWNTGTGSAAAYHCLPYDTDGNPGVFSPAEQSSIVRIWQRVAEDYRTFNVDVTTERPGVFTNTTAHVLVTQDTDANGVQNPSAESASGIAYINVFGISSYASTYNIAFVYQGAYSDGVVARIISHETGHNMGLYHDGTPTQEYYDGHGSGEASWSPIMGSGSGSLVQWTKGEYYNYLNKIPNQPQPQVELDLITAKLGLLPDDYGNTEAAASPLLANGAAVTATGIISNAADTDCFSFTTAAGPVSLSVVANSYPIAQDKGSLDVVAELHDVNGTLLVRSDPPDTTAASISTTLPAGTYYLHVSGTGVGTPLVNPPTGYTAYGSIGQYVVTGTIVPPAGLMAAAVAQGPASQTVFPGNAAVFTVTATGNPATSYQWQLSTSGGSSWQNLSDDSTDSGTAGPVLTVTSVGTAMNGYLYRCTVTNSLGSATSTAATLVVQNPPAPVPPAFAGSGLPVPTFGHAIPGGTSQNLTFTLSAGTEPVTYQWRLNGVDLPGANSLYYYAQDWQPASAGSYTVVATNAQGSVTSGAYTQSVIPEGGWQWRNPLPTGNGLTQAAFRNGLFLVGGLRGTLLVSTDGQNWTQRTVPAANNLYGFQYLNGLYVALGSLGAVFTSPDTVVWTPRNSGTVFQNSSSGLQCLTSSGSRLMAVGLGGVTTTSTDGINWTPGNIGTGDDLNGVTFGLGKFYAVTSSNSRVYSSVDGTAWSYVNSSLVNLNKITFGNGRLVAVGGSGAICTSTDGLAWTTVISGNDNTLIGVDYVNGRFVATGISGTILSSPDGVTWTAANTSGNASNVQNVAYGNGVYLAPGQSGTTGRSLLISNWPDASVWIESIAGSGTIGSSLRGVASDGGAFGGILVAVGAGGTILQSNDGTTWTQRSIASSSQLNDVNFDGTSQFVTVGNSGTVATSSFGVVWALQALGTGNLNGVKYAGGLWVIVGTSGSSARIYTSATGTGWAQRYSGGSAALNKSDYGNGRFVAVGDSGTIVTSADGTTWSAAASGTAGNLNDVTYGGGLHVAVGAGVVLTSPNGTTWTNRSFTTDTLTSVNYAGGWFLATGPGSTYYVSPDGLNWSARFTGTPDNVYDMAVFNNQLYAVGDNSDILCAGIPVVGTSAALAAVAGTPVTLGAAVAASPVPVTYQWQRNGAPLAGANGITLSLASPQLADSGSYTLVATNPFGSTTSAATVLTVSASFSSWQQAHFTSGELSNPTISGPNAVYGLDGLSNLVKYALGLDPKTDILTNLPATTTTASDWVYTYTRPSSITDVSYSVEVSTDLATWTTAGVTLEFVSTASGTDTWHARYPLGSANNVFFRLKVTR